MPSLPTPTPAQAALQDCEIGALFHLDLTIHRADKQDHSSGGPAPDQSCFNPTRLDTDQWLEAARTAGAKYALFTASHETGFMNWSSDLYPYGVKHTSWRGGQGDLVGDFVASCRKYDIAPGLFIGLRRNCWWRVVQYRTRDATRQAAYNAMCERQVEELCTRYGPLCEIWIEGGALAPEEGGPDILPIVERHQPDTVFYHSPARGDHRWVGNESGIAGYPCWSTMPHRGGCTAHDTAAYTQLLATGDPDGPYWSPAMCDVPLRNHRWFWHPDEDHLVRPTRELVEMYYQSVGRNAILTLGLTPDADGLIPAVDMARCAEFGQTIRQRFAQCIAQTSGAGATIGLDLPQPAPINQIVLMEDIAHGERIRAYQVRAKTADGWKLLCEGTCIGHKRIERIAPITVERIELACTQSVAPPRIRQLAVYAPAAVCGT